MAPPAPGVELNENGIPSFDALPLRVGDPHHSAWGLYGDSDQLGTLNRLTDERVAAAAKSEIRTGVRISMNWELDAQSLMPKTFFSRENFHQKLIPKTPLVINDDVWTFNSQVSSQWDGLRHFAYQREAKFYNGVTMEDIHAHHGCSSHPSSASSSSSSKAAAAAASSDPEQQKQQQQQPSTINGIHAWSERGIVGRGILADYESWRLAQGLPFSHFATSPIPLSNLKSCLASQGEGGTHLKFGDILIIRTGWHAALSRLSPSEIAAIRDDATSRHAFGTHRFGGVEQSEEVLRWVWDNFSAVAGDQPSWECWPPVHEPGWAMHEVLLSGWGCPIGELFHLEKLAEHCKREKRWSFFVTSEPCNVPGGVASPPNILAIF